MADIPTLLLLVSLGCLIVGLIHPETFSDVIGDNPTRQRIALIFGSTTFVLLMLAGGSVRIDQAEKAGQVEKTKSNATSVTQKILTKTIERAQSVSFGTEEEKDPSLLDGMTRLRQEGELGEKVVEYRVKLRNGQEVSRKKVDERITKEPTNKIVSVGILKIETSTPEPIVFPTQFVYDPNMDMGAYAVRQWGVNGERVRVYYVGSIDGKEVTRKLSNEFIARKPIPKIIAIGTRAVTPPPR